MIEFRVFGAMSLLGADGQPLRAVLSQPKRIALLTYLAAASPRGFHRRDTLLGLFWPELDQERARAALRQALHGLRQSLGDSAVESRGSEEIRLDPLTVWCDAVALDAAFVGGRHADVVEIYRGDLLAGFFLSGAPEFEQWLEGERARTRRRAVEAAWALAGQCRANGDASLAAHWARHAVALLRDDEEALRRLLGLLGDLGDRAGALQAYDTFARRLADEYEAQPDAETRALIANIRARERSVAVAAAEAPPAAALTQVEADPKLDPLEHAPLESVSAPPVNVRSHVFRHHPPLVAILALIVIVTVSLSAALARGRDGTSLPLTRVVVAGFANRTGDSTLAALGELAREEITRGLALTEVVELADPGLIGGDAFTATRGTTGSEDAAAARALALATGSGLAVWGAYYRRGSDIEVVASIVDQRTGKILRTFEPVRGDPRNPRPSLMILRDHIMVVVAEAVDPRLGASASPASGPPRYEAYEAFITGVGIWYDGRNGRDALPHFTRASALDSSFALPLIWAAWVHQTFGQCDSTEAIAQRLATQDLSRLERLQIDRQLARCRGDLPAAYRLARDLADTRPHSEVWQEQLARDALNFQRPAEAAAILERLHPDRGALRGRASYYNWLTNARHLLRQHELELEVARRGRARFPGNLATWRTELLALSALGRGAEVSARLDEIDALSPDPLRRKPTVLREIALDLAAHGDSVAAGAALRRTIAWHANQPAAEGETEFNRFERAQTYYAAGLPDSARVLAEGLAATNPGSEPYIGLLGVLAAQRGDSLEVRAAVERLMQAPGQHGRGTSPYWRACIAAQAGRVDEAVALLRQALSEGYVFNGLFFLSAHVEPSFAGLRGIPAFEELLVPKA